MRYSYFLVAAFTVACGSSSATQTSTSAVGALSGDAVPLAWDAPFPALEQTRAESGARGSFNELSFHWHLATEFTRSGEGETAIYSATFEKYDASCSVWMGAPAGATGPTLTVQKGPSFRAAAFYFQPNGDTDRSFLQVSFENNPQGLKAMVCYLPLDQAPTWRTVWYVMNDESAGHHLAFDWLAPGP